jgi:transketolase
VNGHDHVELKKVFSEIKNPNNKPKVIIAHTVKGKGISFMENKLLWHYKSPSGDQLIAGINEISNQ